MEAIPCFVVSAGAQDSVLAKSGGESNTKRPDTVFVDTPATMSKVMNALDGLPTSPPSLYIDLEGENLGRNGTTSLLQIFVLPTRYTYLIDVKTLQRDAFLTCGTAGRSLKDVLESDAIPKVIFDVRTDSDALYSHFQINLAGIRDLQLMELATRNFSRRCVSGLGKCIEREAGMNFAEKSAWTLTKEKGRRLFAPECGGSYRVFSERPISDEIMAYCIQDVQYLPRLWSYYDAKLTPAWRVKVEGDTRDRVRSSQSPNFNGKGRHMAMAPAGWA